MEYNDALKELIPLKEPEWELYADGVQVYTNIGDSHFGSEEELKCYIIRYVYNILSYVLIPSEVLYDAGLIYVTNQWIDTWIAEGSMRVEHLDPLPDKPRQRNINFLSQPGSVQETHSKLRLVSGYSKPKPYEPLRLHQGDNTELSWQEEQEVYIADFLGAGLDEYDTFDDDECYYVLEIGECDVQTCAIVTIDPETGEGQAGPSQVQNARKANEAVAHELHPDDYHRFG